MPQIDKVTFLPIVFWTFIFYVGGYLFFNVYFFIYMFNKIKVSFRRLIVGYYESFFCKFFALFLMTCPWISLRNNK